MVESMANSVLEGSDVSHHSKALRLPSRHRPLPLRQPLLLAKPSIRDTASFIGSGEIALVGALRLVDVTDGYRIREIANLPGTLIRGAIVCVRRRVRVFLRVDRRDGHRDGNMGEPRRLGYSRCGPGTVIGHFREFAL
jgi:hypothetical protein